MVKKFSVAFLAVILWLPSAIDAQSSADAETQDALSKTAIITTDCEVGTGFFISQRHDKVTLATALHLTQCQDHASKNLYVWIGQQRYKAKVVKKNRHVDLIIATFKFQQQLPIAEFSPSSLNWGDKLVGVGTKVTENSGSLESVQGTYMYSSGESLSIKMWVWQGMSGGPVFYNGKVMGMVTGRDSEGWGFGYLTSSSVIQQTLKRK